MIKSNCINFNKITGAILYGVLFTKESPLNFDLRAMSASSWIKLWLRVNDNLLLKKLVKISLQSFQKERKKERKKENYFVFDLDGERMTCVLLFILPQDCWLRSAGFWGFWVNCYNFLSFLIEYLYRWKTLVLIVKFRIFNMAF